MPKTDWLLYAENPVATLRRKTTPAQRGSLALPGGGDGSTLAAHSRLGAGRDLTLTLAALNRALLRQRPTSGLIFHSDRGWSTRRTPIERAWRHWASPVATL